MSFWSGIGDAIDEGASTFGDAFTTVASPVGKAGLGVLNFVVDTPGIKQSLEAMNWAYSNVAARPVATLETAGLRAQEGKNWANPLTWGQGGLLDPNFYRNIIPSWSSTGDNVASGAAGISPGQGWVASNIQPFKQIPFDDSPTAVAARKEFFENTAAGKLSSGTADAIFSWYADPLVAVGHGARAVADLGKSTEDAATVAKAFENIRSGAEAPGKLTKVGAAQNRVEQTIREIAGATPDEIWRHPVLKEDTDGALAGVLVDINRRFATDEAKRLDATRDFLGAAMGDIESLKRLNTKHVDLMDELQSISRAPEMTRFNESWAWEDAGERAHSLFKDEHLTTVQARQKEIIAEVDRIDAAKSTYLSRTSGGLRENIAYDWRNRQLNQRYIPGTFGRGLRVVGNVFSNRLPGHVEVLDARQGFYDLDAFLKQAKHTTAAQKKVLLSKYTAASTAAERRLAVSEVEAAIVGNYARKYGLSELAAKEYYAKGLQVRGRFQSALKASLDDAVQGDKRFATLNDPESGEAVVIPLDIAQKMLDDHSQIVDPRLLEKILKSASHQRAIEKLARGTEAKRLKLAGKTDDDIARILADPEIARGTRFADLAQNTADGTIDLARDALGVWKFATLLRSAYPFRIAFDSQARVMTYIGGAQVLLSNLAGRNQKDLWRFFLSGKNRDSLGLKNFFREGDFEKGLARQLTRERTYRGVTYAPAVEPWEVKNLADKLAQQPGTGAQDVIGEFSRARLNAARSQASAGVRLATEPQWFDEYRKLVRDEFFDSPIAMKVLAEPDMAKIQEFVRKDARARAEWDTLKGGYSLEEYVERTREFANHYLPLGTPLRDWALEKNPASSAGAAQDAARAWAANPGPDTVNAYNAHVRNGGQPASVTFTHDGHSVWGTLQQVRVSKGGQKRATVLLPDGNRAYLEPSDITDFSAGRQVTDAEAEAFLKADEANRMHIYRQESPRSQNATARRYNAARTWWFQFAGEAPETILARSPLFNDAFDRQMRRQIDRAEKTGEKLDIEAARRNAETSARKEVGRTLYDASHTSNFSQMFNLLFPFFAAVEDVAKKWYGLFVDKPWIAPRGVHLSQAPNDAGLVYDSEGNKVDAQGVHRYADTGLPVKPEDEGKGEVITIPAKFLPGNYTDGGLTVQKGSLNLVFQGEKWYLPGFGPLVQIPANSFFQHHYAEYTDEPAVQWILPFGTNDDPVWKQAVPSWYKPALSTALKDQDWTDQYNRLQIIETDRYSRGERQDMPTDKEIADRTFKMMLLRTTLKSSVPISSSPEVDDQQHFYMQMWKRYQRDYGFDASDKFYDDFPEWFTLTASYTANDTGIVASSLARKETVKLGDLIDQNPEFGWAIIGPANDPGQPWNQGVATSQLVDDLGPLGNKSRSRLGRGESLEGVQARQGWVEYNKGMMEIDDLLRQRGLTDVNQKGAEDLKAMKSGFTDFMKANNTAWAEDFNTYTTEKAATFLRTMAGLAASHPELADRPDIVAYKQYAEAREELKQMLAQRQYTSLDHPTNADLANAWYGFVDYLKQGNLAFESAWTRLLSHDDFRGEVAP